VAITAYTSYDEVRAVLGVSTDELEDSTLALALYDYGLQAELNDISATLSSEFAAVAAIILASRTTVQQWFFQTAQIFAAYSVAKQAGSGLPLFGPKDISDGKATVSRFADAPYKAVIKSVGEEYNKAKVRLESAYAQLNSSSSTTVARSYMKVSSLSTDPVTGT
jgi:hypothetical protein